ncbi:hypothetical protein TCAL_05190 [Tigriopus californicus]|uniref:Major facilitator superfamily (MFS) profile domain-containing protein n=1 Tax=Tigriopus californicus TaxID=6832 RepID=A0A553NXD7_TIGCA|nr:hypothetical protein TCAL_05190 [Tigriopus californicus]|eukprot:TCALIF_05190-PA protein Name:"Similar to Tret1 Facilitated trehalose transporter Tret1 (Culex quinquefasciatus)" AED:0.32 eAED:0.32 QI:0/1/0.4/1/0.75/0.8/5/0/504
MENNEFRPNQASKWPQILAAVSTTIGAFGLGAGMAWTSPTLPNLVNCSNRTEGCTFDQEFSKEEGSWIGSTYTLGAMVSAIVTGFLLARIGRKWTMLGMAIPFILGWLLLCISVPLTLDEAYWFYIGRALAGFGGGSFSLAAPIYISEISETSIRGALGILFQLFVTSGNVFVNAVGSAVSWEIVTGICIVFPVSMAILMFFMPETPYFLLSKGKVEAGEKSLQWLRGKQFDIHEELEKLTRSVEDQKLQTTLGLVEIVGNMTYLKPLLIMLTLHFFQQFCGINVIVFYLADIFIDAGLNVDNSLAAAAVVSCTQVIATGAAIFVVERLGRRVLLIFSSIVMAIAICALGVYFLLKENNCDQDNPNCQDGANENILNSLGWLPLVSLIIYKFAFAVGYGPLPWMMNGEFFALEAKPISSTCSTVFNWLCAFLVSKFSVNIENGIGTSGMYFMFSAVCLVATVFVLFIVPETRGKSPEEMRRHFDRSVEREKYDLVKNTSISEIS